MKKGQQAVGAMLPPIAVPNHRFSDFARAGEARLIAEGQMGPIAQLAAKQ
jgi:hypothetical protein